MPEDEGFCKDNFFVGSVVRALSSNNANKIQTFCLLFSKTESKIGNFVLKILTVFVLREKSYKK